MNSPGPGSPDNNPDNRLQANLSAKEVKTRAIRGVSSLYLRHVVIRALGFVGMLVLARILTPEIFGVFAIAGFVIHFLQEMSTLGLSVALIRKKENVTREEMTTVFTLQLALTLALAAALYAAAPLIVEHYEMDSSMSWLFRVMGISLLLAALKTIPSALLQRNLRHDLLAVSEVSEYLVYQVAAIGLALAGLEIWALVVATLARGVTGVVIINYLAWWKPRLGFDWHSAKHILRFGIPLQITSLGALANNAVVPVIIGSFLGAAAVGFINFASKSMNAMAWQPLILLGKVQLRVFSTIQDEKEKMERVMETNLLIGCSISFLLASIFVSLAEPTVNHLVGVKWTPALEIIYISTIGYFMLSIIQPYTQALKARGDAVSTMIYTYLVFALQVVLIPLLIEDFGLASYAIAFSAAFVIVAPYILHKAHKSFRPSILPNVLPPLAAAIASGLCAHFASLNIGGIAGMLAGVLLNLLVFTVLLAVLSGEQLDRYLRDLITAIRPAAMDRPDGLLLRACALLRRMHYRSYL